MLFLRLSPDLTTFAYSKGRRKQKPYLYRPVFSAFPIALFFRKEVTTW